jgi:hypothetical protein
MDMHAVTYHIIFSIARRLNDIAEMRSHQGRWDPLQRLGRSRKCGATKADGTPCNAWAVRESDPPRCAAHGGGKAPVGAPPENRNAQTHGFYASSLISLPDDIAIPDDIDTIITDLARKQAALSHYIDTHLVEDITTEDLVAVLGLHATTASRLGKLLRDRRAISGEAADGLAGAIAQALTEAGNVLGTKL